MELIQALDEPTQYGLRGRRDKRRGQLPNLKSGARIEEVAVSILKPESQILHFLGWVYLRAQPRSCSLTQTHREKVLLLSFN